MSNSLMDRLLFDYSMDGSGPLTRSLDDASTSGFIRDDAPHWSIERFIPLHAESLVTYLVGRGELSQDQQAAFRQLCDRIDSVMHERSGTYHTRFSMSYARLDPDSDSRTPKSKAGDVSEPSHSDDGNEANTTEDSQARGFEATRAQVAESIALCEEILEEAAYRRLGRDEIEQCIGNASQWGVPLSVDLGLFQELIVFARGDIIGTKLRRRLRKLYRREPVAVPIYQRMIVLFQLCSDHDSEENLIAEALHLRMFKNIPKQDVDTLLPGTRVRISGIDHVKIIIPSLGGFLMSLRKIAQYALLFAALALHWTAILVVLVLGYMVKSVLSYFQTKKHYQLNLTRNLYFQKLDTNAGVGYHIIQQANRQATVEMILCYYALLSSSEPISPRRLRRRCERMLREAIDVEVDFQLDRALRRLLEMDAVAKRGSNWVHCLP